MTGWPLAALLGTPVLLALLLAAWPHHTPGKREQ